jgi:hypothetical protein
MQTPMQELLKWVRATLPMDLDTPQMIEAKIESLIEKEKEQSISILTKYHNSLFSLPLKDGEAEAIYNHIVNSNKMV